MIHNGIVENFRALRARLEKEGHTLVSETDTECVAHLVEEQLAAGGAGLAEAVRATVAQLEGAYSLVVCSADDPGTLVGVKVSSPLVVGLGDGETILASDIPAILGRTTSVIPLEEGQIVVVTPRRRGDLRPRGQRRCTRSPSRWTGTSRGRRSPATTRSCARRSTSSPPRSATRSSAA